MRSHKLRVTLAGCALLVLAAVSGCGSSSWPEGSTVRVGVKVDQPGTGYSENGYEPYAGFDIMVAQMAAEALGKKVEFDSVKSEDRQISLDGEHDTDLVVATYSINNERLTGSNKQPAHDFAGPYASTYQGFMVKKGSRIKTRDDLYHKGVCVWSGTTSKAAIREEAPDMNLVSRTTALDCINLLKDGGVDAVSTDQLILYGFSKVHTGLKVLPEVTIGDRQHYGIGLPKGHRDECGKLKEALEEYIASPEWSRDFKEVLSPVVAAHPANWETSHKPTAKDIERLSCRDAAE